MISSIRSGLSSREMSQKRHSLADGTQACGLSLAKRRMRVPNYLTNWPGGSLGDARDVVGVGDLAGDPHTAVLEQRHGEGVLADH